MQGASGIPVIREIGLACSNLLIAQFGASGNTWLPCVRDDVFNDAETYKLPAHKASAYLQRADQATHNFRSDLMIKGIHAGCAALLGSSILLFPFQGMAQETWTGSWRADGHSADNMVCRQKWKCVDPGNASNDKGKRDLVFKPEVSFTAGVCVGTGNSPTGCGKCVAEQPPSDCTVTVKK